MAERAESHRRWYSFAGVIVVSIRAEERGRSEDTDQLGAPRYDSVSEISGVAVVGTAANVEGEASRQHTGIKLWRMF